MLSQGPTPCRQKTRPGLCPEPEIIPLRPLMINQAREVFCQRRLPASLIYVLIVTSCPSTLMPLPSRSTSAGPQSFSKPHYSHVPSCLWPRRKQNPIGFALMVTLPAVMFHRVFHILWQRSPQRRFSKQDQPRQTFFFDRLHPAFRVRVLIRAFAGNRSGFTLPV
jgi:hypothetical protein